MPVLEPPVNLNHHPVTHQFWVDETDNPNYRGFYTVFGNHHPGVDIDLPEGTPIKSSLPGIVVRHESHPGMGKTLAIRFGNVYVLYAHLSEFCVRLGNQIKANQLIAYSGNTGQATTHPHLHFELRDLTKVELGSAVFEPVFGEDVGRYIDRFSYTIDNSNTTKTLVFLSDRYFGSPKYASYIRDANPQFSHLDFDAPLPDGVTLTIPSPETGN